MMNLEKISKLQVELSEEAYLFCINKNLRYLTGTDGLEGILMISRDDVYFFTDFRYLEVAARQLQAEVVDGKGRIRDFILDVAGDANIKTLLFEREISYGKYIQDLEFYQEHGLEYLPADNIVDEIRKIKSQDELKLIRKSAEINNEIFRLVLKDIKPGIRELDLKKKLECYLRELGADSSSFDLMVLFGSNTSMPHGRTGETMLKEGDPILFDIGVNYKGYSSDMTRMVSMGNPEAHFLEVYNFVKEVQQLALDVVKPGVSAKKIDEKVKAYLHNVGYQLEHSTGHGVGLEVHEKPFLNRKSEDFLASGMVITIEPGIYIEGRFGVRIEDLLIITDDGYELLTDIDKKLVIL